MENFGATDMMDFLFDDGGIHTFSMAKPMGFPYMSKHWRTTQNLSKVRIAQGSNQEYLARSRLCNGTSVAFGATLPFQLKLFQL